MQRYIINQDKQWCQIHNKKSCKCNFI